MALQGEGIVAGVLLVAEEVDLEDDVEVLLVREGGVVFLGEHGLNFDAEELFLQPLLAPELVEVGHQFGDAFGEINGLLEGEDVIRREDEIQVGERLLEIPAGDLLDE